MYLLCRPLGGLNDCLCQVEYCRKLASKSKRTLVVQTMSGNPELPHRFDEDFNHLFEFDKRVNQIPLETFKKKISSSDSTYPRFYYPLRKHIDHPLKMIDKFGTFKLRWKKLKLRTEDCAVHESDGGGLASANLLTFLLLKKHLYETLSNLDFQESNVGLHFRSSDYKSSINDLEKDVDSVSKELKFYVCSDNKEVFSFLLERFPDRKFIKLSDCVPNHYLDKMSNVEQALLDLLIASMCKNLLVFPLNKTSEQTPKFSGFTRLAKHVWAVNTVNTRGLLFLISAISPLRGLSGSRNIFLSFFYIYFYEIPRIIIQGKNPRGIYKQLGDLMRKKPLNH